MSYRTRRPFPRPLHQLSAVTLPPEMARRLAQLGLTAFDSGSAETLDRHFHQVVVGRGTAGAPVIANIKLTPLTTLAEELGRTVTPMQPPPRFRQDLGVALTDAHRQRMAHRTLGTVPAPPTRAKTRAARPWLIGLVLAVAFFLVWRRFGGEEGADSGGNWLIG